MIITPELTVNGLFWTHVDLIHASKVNVLITRTTMPQRVDIFVNVLHTMKELIVNSKENVQTNHAANMEHAFQMRKTLATSVFVK
jgi:hypothetical protein